MILHVDGSPTDVECDSLEGLGDGFASFGTILADRFQALLECDVCLPDALRWGISTQILFDSGANSAILLFDRPNERPNGRMVVPNDVVEPVVVPFIKTFYK